MRHYLAITAALIAVFLGLFAIVEVAGVPLLTDPSAQMSGVAPIAAGAIGVALLVGDVFVPVPSSVVMFTHGAVFGAFLGAVLSLLGALGAAVVGFAIGRRGGLLVERLVPERERSKADALLARWGTIAVLLTRPLPILAETTAILAGASRTMSWRRLILASLLGALPAAVLYGVAGAYAASFVNLTIVFACVVALALFLWVAELLRRRHGATPAAGPVTEGDPVT